MYSGQERKLSYFGETVKIPKIKNPCGKCKEKGCSTTHIKLCRKLQRAKAKARKLKHGCFSCGWREGFFCNAGDFEFQEESKEMEKNLIGFACESFTPRKEIFLFR